jgi:ribosomal protein L37AE/L43A
MTKKLNAECPTCKTSLPVVIDKQSIVRVTICKKCGDEFQYSAWVMFVRNDKTFHKVELERTASGHHVRPLVDQS